MVKFKVIDTRTGREASSEKKFFKFFIGEDGKLVLADNCGKIAPCNMEFIPLFEGKYPDLEHLERLLLGSLKSLYPEVFAYSFWQPQAELVDMFPQTWPDTAGGFSEPGMVAGQAFTTQFTTVMKVCVHDTKEEYYGVFFGNKPAYIVDHANETFFKDLKKRQIKSKYEAKKAY